MSTELENSLTFRAFSLQTALETRVISHEARLSAKLSSLFSSLSQQISRVKSHENRLFRFEKELKSLCFASLDELEAKLQAFERQINDETTKLLRETSEKLAISLSNAYCSLLQDFHERFQGKTPLISLDFAQMRGPFLAVFEAFEIHAPEAFFSSAKSLEELATESFRREIAKLQGNSLGKVEGTPSKDEEIERKLEEIDEKMRNASKKTEVDAEKRREKGFFQKMKAIFAKKQRADAELSEFSQATEMKLGESAKFRYDPVKKKYIFEGEEEEVEENVPPPLKSKEIDRVSSRIAAKNAENQGNPGDSQRNELLKPPSHKHFSKRRPEIAKTNEKITVFKPNVGENAGISTEIQEKTGKSRYSEGISRHFERVVRSFKEKLASFSWETGESRENLEETQEICEKSRETLRISELSRGVFQEKVREFAEFFADFARPDADLQTFQEKLAANREETREIAEKSLENVRELAQILAQKSRETLENSRDFVMLQTNYFSLLNDSLFFLANSRNPHAKVEKTRENRENRKESQTFVDEHAKVLEKALEDERIRSSRICESLSRSLQEKVNEKVQLCAFTRELLRKSHALGRVFVGVSARLRESSLELQRKREEIKSLNADLREISSKCAVFKQNLRETLEKVEDLTRKDADFRAETRENHAEIVSFFEKSPEFASFCAFFAIKPEETRAMWPDFASFATKLTYFLRNLLKKVEKSAETQRNAAKSAVFASFSEEIAKFRQETEAIALNLALEREKTAHLLRKLEKLQESRENVATSPGFEAIRAEIRRNQQDFQAICKENRDFVEKLSDLQRKTQEIAGFRREEARFVESLARNSEEIAKIQRKTREIAQENQDLRGENREISKKNAQLLGDLKEISQSYREISMKLQENREIFARKDREIKEIQEVCEDLRGKLREKDREIAKISAKNDEISEISAKLVGKEEEILEISKKLKENEYEMREIAKKLSEKDEEIREISKKFREKDEEIVAISAQLAGKDQEIVAISAQLVEKDEEIMAVSTKLRGKDEEIVAISAKFREKVDEILAISAKLRAKDDEIITISSQLHEKNAEFLTISAELREKDQEILAKDEQILMISAQLHEKNEEINGLTSEIRAISSKLSAKDAELSEIVEKNRVSLIISSETACELAQLRDEVAVFRSEAAKLREEREFLQEELAKARVFCEKHQELQAALRDSLETCEVLKHSLGNIEKSQASSVKELQFLRLENEELRENCAKDAGFVAELASLQRLLEKKSKKLELCEEKEAQLLRKLEEFKAIEAKSLEIEEFNRALLKEKKQILEENDKLLQSLGEKDFYKELSSCKQKVKDLEEERAVLKENHGKIVENLQGEIKEMAEKIEKLQKNQEIIGKPAENSKGNSAETEENLTISSKNEANSSILPKNEANSSKTAEKGGFMYNIASFFLTDKELKSVKK